MSSRKHHPFFRISTLPFAIATFILSIATTCNAQPGDFWNVDFTRADSIAFRYHGYSLKKTEVLVDSLTSSLNTDVEKFRAIFRWITDNISYDYKLYLEIVAHDAKRQYNKKARSRLAQRMSKKNLRHLFFRKKAVCSGYATLLEYMCDLAGIECVFISGHARTYDVTNGRPNHAWNAVKLGTKWYLCDVTWASGGVDSDTQRFVKDYDNIYFLTDPSLFIGNHYPVEKRWSLLKDPLSLNDFFQSTFKGHGFIQNKINTYSPDKGTVRVKLADTFQVRFTSNADEIDNQASVVISHTNNETYSRDKINLTRETTGEYMLEISFKQKGSFYVRIYINHTDTFVYLVVVI